MKLYKTQHEVDTFEFASTGTVAIGLPAKLGANGIAVSTSGPEYLIIGKKSVPSSTSAPVLVHPIKEDELYSAVLGTNFTPTIGSTYGLALDSTATKISVSSSTAASGFKVVGVSGTASGSVVIGKIL